jgi:hypothetical protein
MYIQVSSYIYKALGIQVAADTSLITLNIAKQSMDWTCIVCCHSGVQCTWQVKQPHNTARLHQVPLLWAVAPTNTNA